MTPERPERLTVSEQISHIQPGSVVITPIQMYTEMQEIAKKVDHVATLLDPALNEVRREQHDIRSDLRDHEDRLRAQQTEIAGIRARPVVSPRAVWAALTFVTVLVASAAAVVSLFVSG